MERLEGQGGRRRFDIVTAESGRDYWPKKCHRRSPRNIGGHASLEPEIIKKESSSKKNKF